MPRDILANIVGALLEEKDVVVYVKGSAFYTENRSED